MGHTSRLYGPFSLREIQLVPPSPFFIFQLLPSLPQKVTDHKRDTGPYTLEAVKNSDFDLNAIAEQPSSPPCIGRSKLLTSARSEQQDYLRRPLALWTASTMRFCQSIAQQHR